MRQALALRVAAVAALAVILAAQPAAAVAEADASATNPFVVRAWHEPEVVQPGTQWHGFLQLREGHGAARVGYQVCNAGDGFCFAPTQDATDLGNGTYRFDTNDYLAGGRPVDWQAGWRVGVRWFLAEETGIDSNGTWVPRAPATPTEEVAIEDLYLTFDVAGEARRGAPGLGPTSTLVLLSALALAAARRRA